MKLKLIVIGQKHPSWVQDGCEEYLKRFPAQSKPQLIELPLPRRSKASDLAKLKAQEAESILQQIGRQDHMVLLEITGKPFSTPDLS